MKSEVLAATALFLLSVVAGLSPSVIAQTSRPNALVEFPAKNGAKDLIFVPTVSSRTFQYRPVSSCPPGKKPHRFGRYTAAPV